MLIVKIDIIILQQIKIFKIKQYIYKNRENYNHSYKIVEI
jgi:hypothetical protein